jgi:hypothetical protein
LSKRLRNAFAALGVPAGFTLALVAVPGPCTTFNSVDAAGLSDAAGPNAATCMSDATLMLDFYGLEGGEASPECQRFSASHCCDLQSDCLRDEACVSFVTCVNQCPKPRQFPCVNDCGEAARGLVGDLGKCENEAALGDEVDVVCNWFPPQLP